MDSDSGEDGPNYKDTPQKLTNPNVGIVMGRVTEDKVGLII